MKSICEKSPNSFTEWTLRFDVLDFGHGKRGVVLSAGGRALADVDEPVFVAVDQRLEQHSAHQREDGRVGADAQRQREDHNRRQAFAARSASGTQLLNRGKMTSLLAPSAALSRTSALYSGMPNSRTSRPPPRGQISDLEHPKTTECSLRYSLPGQSLRLHYTVERSGRNSTLHPGNFIALLSNPQQAGSA